MIFWYSNRYCQHLLQYHKSGIHDQTGVLQRTLRFLTGQRIVPDLLSQDFASRGAGYDGYYQIYFLLDLIGFDFAEKYIYINKINIK